MSVMPLRHFVQFQFVPSNFIEPQWIVYCKCGWKSKQGPKWSAEQARDAHLAPL